MFIKQLFNKINTNFIKNYNKMTNYLLKKYGSKALLISSAANLISSQSVSVVTDNLPFTSDQSTDCTVTATNILMVNCPDVSFVYNAKKFVETKNRGATDYGTDD